MEHRKEKLYRKVNSTAHGCDHVRGVDASKKRNTKLGMGRTMTSKQRGYDYTPLFRFLLSKVGKMWDDVFSEAVARLDKQEPIFWLVDLNYPNDIKDRYSARHGWVILENSYYNELFVDENGVLQKIQPNYNVNHFYPRCWCCTYTFNGIPITNKYRYTPIPSPEELIAI